MGEKVPCAFEPPYLKDRVSHVYFWIAVHSRERFAYMARDVRLVEAHEL